MTFKTRTQMLNSILNELALVTGTSVQVYTEPIINDYIQRGFDHLYTKRFWNHLTSTTYHTLDGTAGVITDTISGIEKAIDIKWIREEPYTPDCEIYYFSDGLFDTDKMGYTDLAFTDAQYENKRLQFFPATSTANIAIRARRKPDDFQEDDIIPFDSLTLVHFVTASLLAIDGMNPSAQTRQDDLFADRYETLVMQESNNKITSHRDFYTGEFTVEGT